MRGVANICKHRRSAEAKTTPPANSGPDRDYPLYKVTTRLRAVGGRRFWDYLQTHPDDACSDHIDFARGGE